MASKKLKGRAKPASAEDSRLTWPMSSSTSPPSAFVSIHDQPSALALAAMEPAPAAASSSSSSEPGPGPVRTNRRATPDASPYAARSRNGPPRMRLSNMESEPAHVSAEAEQPPPPPLPEDAVVVPASRPPSDDELRNIRRKYDAQEEEIKYSSASPLRIDMPHADLADFVGVDLHTPHAFSFRFLNFVIHTIWPLFLAVANQRIHHILDHETHQRKFATPVSDASRIYFDSGVLGRSVQDKVLHIVNAIYSSNAHRRLMCKERERLVRAMTNEITSLITSYVPDPDYSEESGVLETLKRRMDDHFVLMPRCNPHEHDDKQFYAN